MWLPHSEHEGAMVTVRAARRKCIWPRHYIVVNGIKALNGILPVLPDGVKNRAPDWAEREGKSFQGIRTEETVSTGVFS